MLVKKKLIPLASEVQDPYTLKLLSLPVLYISYDKHLTLHLQSSDSVSASKVWMCDRVLHFDRKTKYGSSPLVRRISSRQ